MDKFLIGLGSGLLLALIVFMIMEIKLRSVKSTAKADNDKLKSMLTDRMEIESEGITRLKSENEKLKKENENLRISIQTYAQKPGRKELQRLQVYQTAVDRLIINSPGFGAAWQAALKDSEIEFEKTYIGVQPFIKKLIPMKTDAAVIKEIDES
ncbi:hypothetical protein [Bullifex porci]|uniref:DNA recombination protein RmuC n=1 Tax=Bullifex porci TaxID=2606638 RepID=A0A7X2PE44_9SPIO|nr:hypothetical protein [Bullifex porci]MDD7255028.1 hypothetical protein [Bullifex porci]MDD7589117.1 hypothetical protein [Bullifex porci]MDY2741501.1 hypothetical protein [Bullifex porci]MSU07256.1 hypothetical protein [Bullifex porci]